MKAFSKEFLMDELGLPGGKFQVFERICNHSRWSVTYEIVFQHEDKFYRTYYNTGATEYQDCSPWEHDDMVECEEVIEVEKLVKVWTPKAQ